MKPITDEQVRLLRRKLMEGKTQEAAAAAAAMSERSVRTWREGALPSEGKQVRTWRTRKDPFDDVWLSKVVPLLVDDKKRILEATTILEALNKEREEGESKFDGGQVRTLQRRMRDWRALHGPEQEVFFQQEHPPGRECALDFTNCNELGVTVEGEAFPHLLFELVLSCSTWTAIGLAFSETFEALVKGFQDALWSLGARATIARSDNLSAATHELKGGGRKLTERWKAVLDHYDMTSTRIAPGNSNENGGVEQRHNRTKRAIAQALILRGSKDFASSSAYIAFARGVVDETHNDKIADRLAAEREHLLPLPSTRVPDYTIWTPAVRCWSTISVNKRIYSVPSRMIGHQVQARQYADVVEVYYRGRLVQTMPRLRGEKTARIDYRHVVWSLVTKPGAFARYRYREELFPTLVFRRAYDALTSTHGDRADIEYVRVLHLAASTMECTVEAALVQLLAEGARFDYVDVKTRVKPERPLIPEMAPLKPDFAVYDGLLAGGAA
jgi:hypothetical protein